MTSQFLFHMPMQMRERLRSRAEALKCSQSDVVRAALEVYLASEAGEPLPAKVVRVSACDNLLRWLTPVVASAESGKMSYLHELRSKVGAMGYSWRTLQQAVTVLASEGRVDVVNAPLGPAMVKR